MKRGIRKIICFLVIIFFSGLVFNGCVPQTSQYTQEGAAIGAVTGAALGALIDKNNRWRGAVIGAVAGAIVVGSAVYISEKAAQEAAKTKKTIIYTSEDGIQKVCAKPLKTQGKCEWVKVQYYEYGKLVKEENKLVCP
ncbi:MAG: hypothetical protein DRP29_01055 [Thermodesulfobacteriota bacterium]|nr:MAG: hypothetical protein DRP29_01055 [Thermodesulfobacteriota bacterium]